ncbi:MAG: phosphoenolpyruvate carboxylase [Candidatus Caenarcaniphilales bacterium]|nr:phosphoenolpyruvate carboxylase [Candidatus Caenarcaniphilales bacterium]
MPNIQSSQLDEISPSIRALYRAIGKIIGKQIYDRVASDQFLDNDPDARKSYADEVINAITQFRNELINTRDFKNIQKIIEKLFDKELSIVIKQLAWILEAYLLLNQSSTASAEVTKPNATLSDRAFMANLIDEIRTKVLQEKDLAKIFTKDFSMNLVLTAHPTAGIQPDYIFHIKNMVNAVQKIAFRLAASNSNNDLNVTQLESMVSDIIDDIILSVSHMVRAKPYNLDRLKPSDESKNFIDNIHEAWEIIPSKIQALEYELKKYLGQEFRIHQRFFRIHSWVARDIDGNPTVTSMEHMHAILQERVNFLTRYRRDLEKLFLSLSDDFTSDPNYPSKTYFVDEQFKKLYESLLEQNTDQAKPYQAYRVVLLALISKLNAVIDHLMNIADIKDFNITKVFNFERDIIRPLELIRSNKVGVNTQEIDLLIRKTGVFGEFGSHGHTRQGADALAKLSKYLTAFWDNQIELKTNFIIKADLIKSKSIDYNLLRSKITIQFISESKKTQEKILQTFDLLELSELGGIKRLIISMNSCFEDMLNALVIAKTIDAFRPAQGDLLPWSRLEIVPLTEQIVDLIDSYKVTLDALLNPAWHQYLIANKGRFYKMRGPSDSGKQNGFAASQWQMFRSKQFDTIVVEIFNAFLRAEISGDDSLKKLWLNYQSSSHDSSEDKIINESIVLFEKFFAGEQFPKALWQKAFVQEDLSRVRLINFDGWGEPIERGGGLEFEYTVKYTQPIGSLPYYERTLQGGGAQQLTSSLRTKQAVQDFINGVSEIAVRRFALDRYYAVESLILDPNFVETMNRMTLLLRQSLRNEVIGIDLEDDNKVFDENNLRLYFRHVVTSPLVFLDLFNIASRPTSRSGTQIKEFLDQTQYSNNLLELANNLQIENILQILADIRAIPYAAMFTLVGGNHVSFYGFDKIISDSEKFCIGKGKTKKTLLEWISYFYQDENDSQEHRLMKHIIDSLEKGIMTADQDCYRRAHEIIEKTIDPSYNSANDLLIFKLLAAQQSTMNFVALVKKYKVNNPQKVLITELLQSNLAEKDLMLARRNDAAVPRMGIAVSIAQIFEHCKKHSVNPLARENIPENLLDLIRKAFAAGASTFGNGCID